MTEFSFFNRDLLTATPSLWDERLLGDLPPFLRPEKEPSTTLTTDRRAQLRRLSIDWDVPVVSLIAEGCLEAGRLGDAISRYLRCLDRVEALGPQASVKDIVDTLARHMVCGAGGVLYAAVICQLFSMEVANEAYRQVCTWPTLKGRKFVKEAKQAYRDSLRSSWRQMRVATQGPAAQSQDRASEKGHES